MGSYVDYNRSLGGVVMYDFFPTNEEERAKEFAKVNNPNDNLAEQAAISINAVLFLSVAITAAGAGVVVVALSRGVRLPRVSFPNPLVRTVTAGATVSIGLGIGL